MGSHFNVSWFWNNENIRDVLKMLDGAEKPVFHICNGSSGIGDIRLDRSIITARHNDKSIRFQDAYLNSCNVQGDLKKLPFKNGVAGTVVCDPPYDYDFSDNRLIDEIVRISKPKAKIFFIAPWIPKNPVIQLKKHELWIVGKKKPYYKIASTFYKSNGQIGDYV